MSSQGGVRGRGGEKGKGRGEGEGEGRMGRGVREFEGSLFFFFFKLYNIVLVLPNIKMNPPQV